MDKVINFIDLESNHLADLQAFARQQLGIRSVTLLRKKELIDLIQEKLREESERQNAAHSGRQPAALPTEESAAAPAALEKPAAPKRGRPRKKAPEAPAAPEVSTDANAAASAEAEVSENVKKALFQKAASAYKNKLAAEKAKEAAEKMPEEAEAPEGEEGADRGAAKPKTQADLSNAAPVQGVLEIAPDGYGFLRTKNYFPSEKDIYVSNGMIKKHNLRNGDHVKGLALPVRSNDKFPPLHSVEAVNDVPYTKDAVRPHFDALTPVFPDARLTLETAVDPSELATRIIDLIAPIGKGQRGLIVSPPKAGKTMLLKKIANAITMNYPEVKLIILLIDERPEEVTDIQRSTNVEVAYSTFDELPEHHTKISEMVLERSKRLVEQGRDVVILMDSITRLARAYNITVPVSGRSLSGGLDPSALFKPKKFFGAARNIENGGSLTIIATALIDTGSRMDEVIFEEFKGTGNMEIHLDRKLSERRIFPAIDLNKSGTRREDLLLSDKELESVQLMRKHLSEGRTDKVAEFIISTLSATKNNAQFIKKLSENFASADKNKTPDDQIINNLFNY